MRADISGLQDPQVYQARDKYGLWSRKRLAKGVSELKILMRVLLRNINFLSGDASLTDDSHARYCNEKGYAIL